MNVPLCNAGRGIYGFDDSGKSIQTSDFELFATEKGVELIVDEAWDFGKRVMGQVD